MNAFALLMTVALSGGNTYTSAPPFYATANDCNAVLSRMAPTVDAYSAQTGLTAKAQCLTVATEVETDDAS